MSLYSSHPKIFVRLASIWLVLFIFIFWLSSVLSHKGVHEIEVNVAKENNQRVLNMIKTNLKYIYLLNLDNAYWDDMYNYILNPRQEFIEHNLANNLFEDNRINYVVLLDSKLNIKWHKGFSLAKKINIDVPGALLDYLKLNAARLIDKRDILNNLIKDSHGYVGFYRGHNEETILLTITKVTSPSASKKTSAGYLVFAKILTPAYLEDLSKDIEHNVSIYTVKQAEKLKFGKEIIYAINHPRNNIDTRLLNEDAMASFRMIRDADFKPVSILKVSNSRELYLESLKNAQYNQIIIFFLTFLTMLFILYLTIRHFDHQKELSKVFKDFLPKDISQLFTDDEIAKLPLGHPITKEATFAEICLQRDNISEAQLSQIISELSEAIKMHNGYIERLFNGKLYAIFSKPKTMANDAIRSALIIKTYLEKQNAELVNQNQKGFTFKIVIHSGNLALSLYRHEKPLISNPDSITSKILLEMKNNTLTQHFPIIISSETLNLIKTELPFFTTVVGSISLSKPRMSMDIHAIASEG